MHARRLLAIGLGAIVGGALRWSALTGLGVDPYVVLLLVNTAASGLLGWVQAGVRSGRLRRGDLVGLLGAGLCGTLSTWSALAVELGDDLRSGEVLRAVAWTVVSVTAGVGAAWAGAQLQRDGGATAGSPPEAHP